MNELGGCLEVYQVVDSFFSPLFFGLKTPNYDLVAAPSDSSKGRNLEGRGSGCRALIGHPLWAQQSRFSLLWHPQPSGGDWEETQ